ncbi:FKBP12-associated protein [Coemansia brasiliensis]|uniref:FKBP12-associated protein n=1 Tax=Coemansia brasiliensis TaxID=2650707 RepID=A0A9W8IFI7_9FUNG|nr:FKBP12-associated protein [Coemansia brasiliensis]
MTLKSNSNSSNTLSVAGLNLEDPRNQTCPPESRQLHSGSSSISLQYAHDDSGHAVNTRPNSGRSQNSTRHGDVTGGNGGKPGRFPKGNRHGKAPSGKPKQISRSNSANETANSNTKPKGRPLQATAKEFVPRAKANLQTANNAIPKQQTKNKKNIQPESEHQSESRKQHHNANKPSRSQKNKAKARDGDYHGRKSGKSRGMVGGGRTFNGSLTNDNDVSDSNYDGATSYSQDLSTTLAKRLFNGSYECMICCDKVRPRHAIWHCDKCWAVFHIGCVKKWVKSCSSDSSDQWRCPGCQYGRAAEPAHYFCFCGAVRDPEPARGCTPHSCGQICGRNRGPHCVHPCPLLCHPGPCPPCTAMAPEQWCFCGRLSYQPRCGADYDPTTCIKSCGSICGDVLGCGRHKCEEPCHSGLCPPCPHKEEQQCYCGKHKRTVRCGAGNPQPTFVVQEVDGKQVSIEQTGHYDCGETCKQTLGCGIHKCERSCHPLPEPGVSHGECPWDPEIVSACHCGKKLASELGAARTKCTDPVPSCNQECQRQLPGCSHTCTEACHVGACPPCEVMVEKTCMCGATKHRIKCSQAQDNTQLLQCERLCSKMRACRRHQCSVRCCPSDHTDMNGTVVPSERIAPGVTDPHQCTLPCGRLLRCKNHLCEELCHRGSCPPCRNAEFEELSCPCGRTRLLPPIPCGTKLPRCHFPCQRTRECGHINLTSHECHPDSVSCPPCPVLVTTQCMCGGKEMKNIPCHRSHAASCGRICNKLLPCGGHRCQRSCHRSDEPCLRGQPCKQLCKKPRKGCGHPCKLFCHSPAMCDESKPCETMVNVSCGCGRMTAQQICGATAGNGHSTSNLACNEVCKIAERNRRLALALNIKDRADTPLAGLVKASYSDELLQFTRTHLSWVRDIESRAASFIGEKNCLTLNFAPMKPQFRAFLHALGPFYGCRSRSVDYEPLRSVCWDRTGQSTIPSISLSNAVQYTVVPQIVCSSRIHANDDSDGDDSASLDLNVNVKSIPRNSAVDRLRRKLDFLVISDLRHGLVEEELREAIDRYVPSKAYTICWMEEDRVEMYCKHSEAKNEYLQKWEAMLKSKLPLQGIAGMVKGMRAASDLPPYYHILECFVCC